MSDPRDDGGRAFPTSSDDYDPGMSLRDYFAALALVGVVQARVAAGLDAGQESIAEECYELADALLAARSR